jgi:alanyl-tRNA synthetase
LKTDKLYSTDSYRRAFEAEVVARETMGGRPAVALDRTAFYPTGGGQPHDTGALNGIPVVDVVEQDGVIWHGLDGQLDQPRVRGEIDWARRWDHMQNHTGQHVLSQAFILTAEAETVAWHLSPHSLTIDVARVGLEDGDLERAERLANAVVQENRAVTSRLVAEEVVAGLALRKAPQVDGPWRIVEIAGFDRVACGGTHVSGTAEVGVLKILRVERRGQETRIHFVCGGRAVADYSRKHQLVRTLAARFTRGEDELLQAVEQLQQEAQANHRALKVAQEALVAQEAGRLAAAVAGAPAPRKVQGVYADWQPEQVKKLALVLRGQQGCFIALAGGDPPQVYVARSDDVEVDAGQVLRAALVAVGGRGGGKADYAQGSAPSLEAAAQVVESLIQEVKHSSGER